MMCLAEALLRIPDAHTADELIADKLSGPDWTEKLGQSNSAFVNAATFSLLLTGKVLEGAQGPQRQLARRAWARRRPAWRAGGAHRRHPGDEDSRSQVRVRPDDRRGAAARRAGARRGPKPQLRHAWRGRAYASRTPSVTPRPTATRSTGSPSEAEGGIRHARPGFRSSCRRFTRATNTATPTRPRRPCCRSFASWR